MERSEAKGGYLKLIYSRYAECKTINCRCEESRLQSGRRSNLNVTMENQFYIYIMTNPYNSVTYVGVTSNLQERVSQHREKAVRSFTGRYNINKLVYYEIFSDAYSAISREKQIKGGSRQKKVELINSLNPNWEDLSGAL